MKKIIIKRIIFAVLLITFISSIALSYLPAFRTHETLLVCFLSGGASVIAGMAVVVDAALVREVKKEMAEKEKENN